MMKLLVSPRDLKETKEAIAGGADIIDIKNPIEGSLGANFPWIIKEIIALKSGSIEFSATIGDLYNLPGTAALAALGAASCGVDYVKAGLYEVNTTKEATKLSEVIVKAVKEFDSNVKVVLAGYADYSEINSIAPIELPLIAYNTKADYVMIDTKIKNGKTLLDHMSENELKTFTSEAHKYNLGVALGGSLNKTHVQLLKKLKVDVMGVRGAVCDKDRTKGTIRAEKVKELRETIYSDE